MSWYIPLDAVTLWATGTIVALLVVTGIVCFIKGREEEKWPETTGEVLDYEEVAMDGTRYYYVTLRLHERNGLPPVVRVTRRMSRKPGLGSQLIVKHHPQGKKIWVKGETPGTLRSYALACFGIAIATPFGVLSVIDWSA